MSLFPRIRNISSCTSVPENKSIFKFRKILRKYVYIPQRIINIFIQYKQPSHRNLDVISLYHFVSNNFSLSFLKVFIIITYYISCVVVYAYNTKTTSTHKMYTKTIIIHNERLNGDNFNLFLLHFM